ncbi:MAG: 2-amino-4-hydroxy-6-hydroxymethyldihydropteridine diphosphokinase [Bacteroidales bacterium]|jgi:2-amino-4-hydroxy-6-hydroxymethyldihydropteridine diphosphokinase
MKGSTHILYLLLGSNLGDKKKNLDDALEIINKRIGLVSKTSSLYETEPWGFTSEDYFLNMAAKVDTLLSPEEVLQQVNNIELDCGRKRQGMGYESRTIDIDILFYDDLILATSALTIPHPHIEERRFVLVPLNEIAKDLIHPGSRNTITELMLTCHDSKKVMKL